MAEDASWKNFCNIFKPIFSNKNVRIAIKFSLKFVPHGALDNKSALIQVMAWHRKGNKPLPEPMLIQFTDAYMSGEMS